jgi:hypothetical protein
MTAVDLVQEGDAMVLRPPATLDLPAAAALWRSRRRGPLALWPVGLRQWVVTALFVVHLTNHRMVWLSLQSIKFVVVLRGVGWR